jgi:hypothetical protein
MVLAVLAVMANGIVGLLVVQGTDAIAIPATAEGSTRSAAGRMPA